jgi:hypothetical protein
MPDLEHGAYDIDSDEDEPPELMTRENTDSSDDDSEDDENEEDANTRDTDKFDDTMTSEMNILQDMEKAEKLIDQEIQEISDIHLHTPHAKTTSERPNAPYSEYDLDMLVSKTITNQLNEQRAGMEMEWAARRAAMEHECKEALEKETSVQRRLVAKETADLRKEFQTIHTDIATVQRSLEIVHQQNEALQKTTDNKARQLGHLQAIIADIKQQKAALHQETDTSKRTTQEAKQMQQNLETEARTITRETIQLAVDRNMTRVEKAIHATIHKKAKTLVTDAKREMLEALTNEKRELLGELMEKKQSLEEDIERTTEATFNEATSLLDRAVMQIGQEMHQAVEEFRNTLSEPHEKTQHVERTQQRMLRETTNGRPPR